MLLKFLPVYFGRVKGEGMFKSFFSVAARTLCGKEGITQAMIVHVTPSSSIHTKLPDTNISEVELQPAL